MPATRPHLYADTADHIQDRNDLGHFWDRKKYGGHWWGPDARSTWVHEYGVPLSTPEPPFVPNRYRQNGVTPTAGPYQPDPPRGRPDRYARTTPLAPFASSGSTASSGPGFYRYGPPPPFDYRRNQQRSLSPDSRWTRGSTPSTRRSSRSRSSPPPGARSSPPPHAYRRYNSPRNERMPSPPRQRTSHNTRWPERNTRTPHRAVGPMGTPKARQNRPRDDETQRLRLRTLDSRKTPPPPPNAEVKWVRTTLNHCLYKQV
ncbi:hypothetical protein B0H11DRAFT_2240099 [Mycena galericulata]|nr:hypothetical protein B0H11DRAFT_2240099 [Mycena galericulata]